MDTFKVLLLLELAPITAFCVLYLIVGWEMYVQGKVFPFQPTYPRNQSLPEVKPTTASALHITLAPAAPPAPVTPVAAP